MGSGSVILVVIALRRHGICVRASWRTGSVLVVSSYKWFWTLAHNFRCIGSVCNSVRMDDLFHAMTNDSIGLITHLELIARHSDKRTNALILITK